MNKWNEIIGGLMNHPMARKHQGGVLLRFAWWQLFGKKKYKEGMLAEWINGTRILVYPGRAAATGIFYLGFLEYEEMTFLYAYANKKDIFCDVGANVGVYSLLMGNICKKIYAFEPGRDTCEILKRNIEINRFCNIEVLREGVGSHMDKLYFTVGKDTMNHVVLNPNEEEKMYCEKIPVVTLDERIESEVDILKIDVEGLEQDVLAGAEKILCSERLNVVIMETFGKKELIEKMRNYGFSLWYYEPMSRELLPEPSKDRKEENNGIFIKDIDKAKERLRVSMRSYKWRFTVRNCPVI